MAFDPTDLTNTTSVTWFYVPWDRVPLGTATRFYSSVWDDQEYPGIVGELKGSGKWRRGGPPLRQPIRLARYLWNAGAMAGRYSGWDAVATDQRAYWNRPVLRRAAWPSCTRRKRACTFAYTHGYVFDAGEAGAVDPRINAIPNASPAEAGGATSFLTVSIGVVPGSG